MNICFWTYFLSFLYIFQWIISSSVALFHGMKEEEEAKQLLVNRVHNRRVSRPWHRTNSTLVLADRGCCCCLCGSSVVWCYTTSASILCVKWAHLHNFHMEQKNLLKQKQNRFNFFFPNLFDFLHIFCSLFRSLNYSCFLFILFFFFFDISLSNTFYI